MLENLTKNKNFMFIVSAIAGFIIIAVDNHYKNISFDLLSFVFSLPVCIVVGYFFIAFCFAAAEQIVKIWNENFFSKIIFILIFYTVVYFYGFK